MRVIATAGHVDHGKSTLVHALTGTDPDRLTEEKQRGLTIDLGFAGFDLPNGEKLAFVDVPGHRRFIGNMLAGLGPAPVVMLVVAADQGWQAQSTEHLEAIDALGLRHGILVLTRVGLADAERVGEVRKQALERIAQTSLGQVPVVQTDAVSGQGVNELRAALNKLVDSLTAPDDDAPVRLWVDRAFTIKGTGTVVTGTLAAGTIRIGDAVEIAGERATVRSLQVLGESASEVGPVSRVAVALRGLSRDAVMRGDVLLSPGTGLSTSGIDVVRRTGHPWREAEVSVHLGTAVRTARVRPFDDEIARLTLSAPLDIRLGDHLIIRDDSASRIHCGATVLDCDPAPLTRRGAGRRRGQLLHTWQAKRVSDVIEDRGLVRLDWLERANADQVPDVMVAGDWAVAAWQRAAWVEGMQELLNQDANNPLSRGIAMNAVAERLNVPVPLVPEIAQAAKLTIDDGRVLSDQHQTGLGVAAKSLDTLRARLMANPFDAPEADELADLKLGVKELAAAAARGLILRLPAQPADIILLTDAPARAMRELAQLPQQPFTVSDAREALGTTRRIAIPLLEHLDGRGWTRREGNARYVVR